MELLAGKQLVFICGLHRSGTGLIQNIIASSTDVSALSNTNVPEDEGQHLQNVYSTAKDHGGPGQFALDHMAYMNEKHSAVTEENAQLLMNSWSPYWSSDARIYLEKSPINTVRSRFLQALFPNAKFISIWRHPLAVAEATKKWTDQSISHLIQHCITARHIFDKDKDGLQAQLQLSYEELTDDTEHCMAKINDFLSLDLQLESISNTNIDYFKDWKKPKAMWRLREFNDLVSTYEDQLLDLGYSLNDLSARPNF